MMDESRALENAQLEVADTAAQFVDGDASIVDLRKAVADWRAATQNFLAAQNAPRNRRFVTIETSHVGKALFDAFGRKWPVSGFIGRIMKQDVGKRVYLVGDILQVENDEQRAARFADEDARTESDERRATGPMDR
jgi:hypothetical protein